MIKHLRVLLVDDDTAILSVLGTFLEAKGYAVETETDGAEALAALRRSTFHLIVCDIRMDGLDGFEFLQQARAEDATIGIILMTAYDGAYSRARVLRAGADEFITKPFTLERFALIFERGYWRALSRMEGDEADEG